MMICLLEGARRMIEAAELALTTLVERNQLLSTEENASQVVEDISDGPG
jgi:hypothetical protein